MRRSIALLVGVATVLVCAARPVAAAPGAPTNPGPVVTVPADAVDLTLSQVAGSGLAVTLDAGASEEHDIVVSNHTANLRLTIKLTATDATGNLGAAAASWLAFGDDAIQLDPHAATTVPMTIAVPHDTQPGSDLAHVNATVESAVAAADGSPVEGTVTRTFPVSIAVQGASTAQIAVADVHRVDRGSTHQLAVVLRNFGDQGAQVSGHVRIAGDQPQTLPFHANLDASRDTTIDLGWNAPPAGSPSDIAVDVEYGGGNVASWSSRLGGAPTDLLAPSGGDGSTPTTAADSPPAPTDSGSAVAARPWWKAHLALLLFALALLGAAGWFGFEMRASRRRRYWDAPRPERDDPRLVRVPVSNDESLDLARQLVRLTEVVVELVASQRQGQVVAYDRVRARSPVPDPAGAFDAPGRPRSEVDELQHARAGPAPPTDAAVAAVPPALPFDDHLEIPRSASATPGAPTRPDDARPGGLAAVTEMFVPVVVPVAVPPEPEPPEVEVEAIFVEDAAAPHPEPAVEAAAPIAQPVAASSFDASAGLIARLMELDRERRRLRHWMDAEESGETIEPPPAPGPARYRTGRTPGATS